MPPANRATVAQLDDMSGNGRHLAEAAVRPSYWNRAASLGGRPGIQGPGRLLTSAFTSIPQPWTIGFVGTMQRPQYRLSSARVAVGMGGATSPLVLLYADGGNGGKATAFAGTNLPAPLALDPHMFRFTANGASSAVAIDGAVTSGNAGAAGIAQVSIFQRPDYLNSEAFSNFGITGLAFLYAGDITGHAGWAAFYAAALDHYRVAALRNLIVCDGDSRTSGWEHASFGNTWPAILDNLLASDATVLNLGVGSQTLNNMASDAATEVDPLYSASYARSVAICYGGINDVFAGDSAATAQGDISTYCAARQSTGFDVLVGTLPPASTVSGAAETVRTTVNTWLRANYGTFADGLVDFAADPRLTNTADTTYFDADGVHFTATGYAVHAELVAVSLAGIGVT